MSGMTPIKQFEIRKVNLVGGRGGKNNLKSAVILSATPFNGLHKQVMVAPLLNREPTDPSSVCVCQPDEAGHPVKRWIDLSQARSVDVSLRIGKLIGHIDERFQQPLLSRLQSIFRASEASSPVEPPEKAVNGPVQQYDICWVNLNGKRKGTETRKHRPSVVVSADHFNIGGRVLVAPLLQQVREGGRVAVRIKKSMENGLDVSRYVDLSQLRSVEVAKRVGQLKGHLEGLHHHAIVRRLQAIFQPGFDFLCTQSEAKAKRRPKRRRTQFAHTGLDPRFIHAFIPKGVSVAKSK